MIVQFAAAELAQGQHHEPAPLTGPRPLGQVRQAEALLQRPPLTPRHLHENRFRQVAQLGRGASNAVLAQNVADADP